MIGAFPILHFALYTIHFALTSHGWSENTLLVGGLAALGAYSLACVRCMRVFPLPKACTAIPPDSRFQTPVCGRSPR